MADDTAVAATNFRNARALSAAVALDDVVVAFRLAGGVYTAIEHATLHVADGEFVAIVGPTGCGKSTLLNVTAGLLTPAGGGVNIFGSPLVALNRQAGYLFQADALFPWKTALENVAIGLETAGTPVGEARMRARAWLTRVGLSAFGDRYPHMLSGGQRKRVGLAQVLSMRRRVRSWETYCSISGAQIARQCCSLLTIWKRLSRCPIGS
jgi:sulfonate transport system ATP-binding protein